MLSARMVLLAPKELKLCIPIAFYYPISSLSIE